MIAKAILRDRRYLDPLDGVKYAVLRIPSGSSEQGRMVDALTEEGDERRGIAAICFGEVLSNL